MNKFLFYSFAALVCMISMQRCEESPDTKAEEPFNPPAADTCGWNWDVVPTDTVIIVRNEEALLSCLVCEDGNVPPAIDFDKQMVLLARGTVQGEIVQVTHALTESSGFYTLKVRVKMANTQTQTTKAGITTSAVESDGNDWSVAVVIDKIKVNNVQLAVAADDFPIGYHCDIIPTLVEWSGMERPADAYNYPLYPCMDEWAFLTIADYEFICQIPEDTVKKLSTQALIQAFWEYPFFEFVQGGMQSNSETGIANLKKYFSNAYNELTTRQDAGILLKERYLLLDPMRLAMPHFLYLISLEVLISQPCFISQMPLADKKELFAAVLHNDDLWQNDPYFAGGSRLIPYVLMGRLMEQGGYEPFLSELSTNSTMEYIVHSDHRFAVGPDEELISFIRSHAEEFLK